MTLRNDPYINAIQDGIMRDIDVVLENKRHRAAIILMLAGIDAMAYLYADTLPHSRRHYISWVDRYLRFAGDHQLTGVDVYGARCAFLHAYTMESELSKSGNSREIGWFNDGMPPVRIDTSIDSSLIMVSIRAFKVSLFEGMNRFFIESFADSGRKLQVEERLKNFMHVLPANDVASPAPPSETPTASPSP